MVRSGGAKSGMVYACLLFFVMFVVFLGREAWGMVKGEGFFWWDRMDGGLLVLNYCCEL